MGEITDNEREEIEKKDKRSNVLADEVKNSNKRL